MEMKPFKMLSTVTIRDTNPLVREHRVHNIHILPGVSLLDVVYKTLARAEWEAESVILRNILFHEPVVTHENMDRYVTVSIEVRGSEGTVRITSVPSQDEQTLSEQPTLHMTCSLEHVQAWGLDSLPVDFNSRVGEAVDLDCCYGVTRHIGICHDRFMKCLGSVSPLSGGQCVATVALGEAAAAKMSDFMLHPVFLDCSTIVPLFNLRHRLDEARLFIPFAIEEFRARCLSQQKEVCVVVEESDIGHTDAEILRYSSALYDSEGRALARIHKFGVKRVRSLNGIHRLLESGINARNATGVSPKPLSVATVVAESALPGTQVRRGATNQSGACTDDVLLSLLGELIVQYGKVSWNTRQAQTRFFDLGLDSLALLEIAEQLEKKLNVRLYPTLLFECPTAAQLAAYLRETFSAEIAEWEAKRTSGMVDQLCQPDVVNDQRLPPVENAEKTPRVLIPQWMPVLSGTSGLESSMGTVALLGGVAPEHFMEAVATQLGGCLCYQSRASQSADLVREFQCALDQGLAVDAVWLVGADHDVAFALVQVLSDRGRLASALNLKAITFNAFSVHNEATDSNAGHGIWGLWQSVSREYPNVKVSLCDLDRVGWQISGSSTRSWFENLVQGEGMDRELHAVRAGRVYSRNLYGIPDRQYNTSQFRDGGVYLIFGGSGGVGMELARYLRRRYAAKVAISGRRPLDSALRERLASIGTYGRDVIYVQAFVDDEAAVQEAITQVQSKFGILHGVVHSAMVLGDKRLAHMSAEDFARVLRPKVEGTRALTRATKNLPLDFLLFFSSIQSFVGNICQANYAAASTFLDGFAASVRAERPYPVVVINWGFWSEVGAVSTEVYRSLLTRQGLFGLCASDAWEKLEYVLSAGHAQALVVAAKESVLQQMGWKQDFLIGRQERGGESLGVPLPIDLRQQPTWRTIFADTDRAMQLLLALARRRIGRILSTIGLYGNDSITVEEAVKRGQLSSQYATWASALLRHLGKVHGPGVAGLDAEAFADALSTLAATHPAVKQFIPLLHTSIAAYPEILRGHRSGVDTLFPGGSSELVRAVYSNNDISRFYNHAVANAVLALAIGQTSRPVRILEIGAGTGATSTEVLRVLADSGVDCEYHFTDLWDRLVTDARDTLGRLHPNVRFSFLDISIDPARQGVHETFDLVLATNVLHATRDLRLSLQHAKCLLREGGAIVVNESVAEQEFSTYTFGLLPGWWNAVDRGARLPDSPLADAETWRRLLREEGFVDECGLIAEDEDLPVLNSQQIFVARSNGETRHPTEQRISFDQSTSPRKLPPALMGKLRPYELSAAAGRPGSRLRYMELLLDERDNIWLFLDHPPANTFTEELLGELCSVLHRISGTASTATHPRLLYVSHYGEYFSLGGDRPELMRHLRTGNIEALYSFAAKARELLQSLATFDGIVVAVVNGTAQGGGLETLLATDLQLVREGVKLGLPEIRSGLIPGMGGLTYLQGQVGAARTKRLVMLGELISAREAQDLGMISHVIDDPYAAALDLPNRLVHLETAQYMKRILGCQKGEELVRDIDEWFQYLTQYENSIDTQRIAASATLLNAKAMRNRK